MINKTIIVSAFPGCGKSTFHKSMLEGNYKVNISPDKSITSDFCLFDSDSSNFNKDHFPENYITHLKVLSNGTGCKMILVSSHDIVRKEMFLEGIPYLLVYPSREIKEEYIQRYIDRGNNDLFINLLKEKWDDFIDSCEKDPTVYKLILKSGQYLTDVLLERNVIVRS